MREEAREGGTEGFYTRSCQHLLRKRGERKKAAKHRNDGIPRGGVFRCRGAVKFRNGRKSSIFRIWGGVNGERVVGWGERGPHRKKT